MKKDFWKKTFLLLAAGVYGVWVGTLAWAAASYTGVLAGDQQSGTPLLVKNDRKANWSMFPDGSTIGFIGTAYLESSLAPNDRFQIEQTFTGTVASAITTEQTGTYYNESRRPRWLRFRIENIDDDNTSASFTYRVTEGFDITKKLIIGSGARAGATSGWTFSTDVGGLGQLPDAQTGSTLIIPVDAEVGDIIIGYHANGQIEGDAGTGTFNIEMRRATVAAGSISDAVIGNMSDQVTSEGSDLLLSSANTGVTLDVPEEVTADEYIYLLVTGFTLPVSDIDLQSVQVDSTKRSLFP